MPTKRDTLGNAYAKVNTHKSTGSYDGFESINDRDTLVETYGEASCVQCVSDCLSEWGSSRVVTYTYSSMTFSEKQNSGMLRINSRLLTAYTHSSSIIVHEGDVGKLVFVKGVVYHIVSGGNNSDDFTKFQNLLERHIAYKYIDGASNSTNAEKAAALADYEDYRDNSL